MAQDKKELEWKNHAPFFTNLNDDLKFLKYISTNRNMRDQQKYYQALYDFKTHYCVYVKTKSIDEKLKEVRDVLYSINYPVKTWSKEYYKKVLEVMDLLRDIHEEIIIGVYESQLIPQFEMVDISTPAAAKQKR